MDFDLEIRRTRPDFVVYQPGSDDGSTCDTGNEHFLVFDGPDGSLMAVWTQSTREGMPDQRIVFSQSVDEGVTWAKPRLIAGTPPSEKGNMASWAFPMVSNSGRIYVVYSRHIGVNDVFSHTTGLMGCIYSDDAGQSWSDEQIVPMRRSIYDNTDPDVPANWIVWQRPNRYSEGKYIAGFTRWVSPAVRHPPPVDHWIAQESVVEFMRFENLDDDPEPVNLKLSWFAADDDALKQGFPGHPDVSVLQEPSMVLLPDERLFVTMRSPTGRAQHTVSDDRGVTWRPAAPLLQFDGGPELLHPNSPCPIYPIGNGRYLFLHHNHDGHIDQWGPFDTSWHRRPIYGRVGAFRPDAHQPLWFSPPKLLMDNEGVAIGAGGGRADMAMYASFTIRNGERILWYPDRKFFLLGKRITDEWLSTVEVPGGQ